MSTLKTTNLQESNASGANIVLGTGSGGGATISGVTTSSTLRATTGIVTTATITTADVTTSRTTTGITTTAVINTATVGGVNILNSDGVNTTGIVTAKAFVPTESQLSHRNLIINGSAQLWQRATSLAVTDGTNEGLKSVDRFYNSYVGSANGAHTISKSTDAPDGFSSSIKLDVTTVNSNSGDGSRVIYLYQNIEAQNVVNSGWKQTSTSSYLTFSFYFKSNKSGTNKLAVSFVQNDYSYSYITDVTVSDTNWNRYSVTIPGHASLSIPNTNAGGLRVALTFMASPGYQAAADQWVNSRDYGTSNSTNWFNSTSNDMYTTGWQVEVGSVATPYEHRTYADELAACQRYYYRAVDMSLQGGNDYTLGYYTQVHGTTGAHILVRLHPTMRAVPSFEVSNASGAYQIIDGANGNNFNEIVANGTSRWSNQSIELWAQGGLSGLTAGQAAFIRCKGGTTTTYLAFNAEI